MKKAAPLSSGLVAVKGSAAPALDVPTRSPEPAAAKATKTPLNFKLEDEIVLSFKSIAVRDRLKLNELFKECLAAYVEKKGR